MVWSIHDEVEGEGEASAAQGATGGDIETFIAFMKINNKKMHKSCFESRVPLWFASYKCLRSVPRLITLLWSRFIKNATAMKKVSSRYFWVIAGMSYPASATCRCFLWAKPLRCVHKYKRHGLMYQICMLKQLDVILSFIIQIKLTRK